MTKSFIEIPHELVSTWRILYSLHCLLHFPHICNEKADIKSNYFSFILICDQKNMILLKLSQFIFSLKDRFVLAFLITNPPLHNAISLIFRMSYIHLFPFELLSSLDHDVPQAIIVNYPVPNLWKTLDSFPFFPSLVHLSFEK